MARIKIELPESLSFATVIPIRITDLNYGGHVGNDTILSLIHEARVQFLTQKGTQELGAGGIGLIMSDVAIEFKAEVFYGEQVRVSVGVGEFSRVGFELYYKLEKQLKGKDTIVAQAKTGLVCYNYELKKIAMVPEALKTLLLA
jgi:acyl-CoA thioester hydrolase